MKKILITGGSGFVGKYLAAHFLSENYSVTGLGTSSHHPFELKSGQKFENFKWISADTTREGAWQEQVARADVVINLAGQNIFKPWTKKYKQAIYDSRILTTKHLVAAMEKGAPAKLLSASAVGYYGDCGETILSETDPAGSDFLALVCRDWEDQALEAKNKEVRVCLMRFGVVLGNEGALSVMTPAFKWFAGGPLGGGRQWFPWIHIHDLYRGIRLLMEEVDLEGIFNFTGPGLVRQKEFATQLGRALNRPALLPAPAFMVKLAMGDLGSSLLQSQRATPQRLTELKFEFEFKTPGAALAHIFEKR
ncbi:MAG: TIGR01777 family protein [Deltaproteobacteria bacterium]|nr:MAG: TIGR01777 family protein [Deltaproteobacteria bacterium]